MAGFDYDLFVIGGGSGGVRAARMAAATGVRVAIAETYRYGGTCVIRGCVPKKLLSYAAHFHEDFEDAAGFGWTVPQATFDWAALIANKDQEIERLEGIYEKLLAGAGVEAFHGHARLLDAHSVEAGERRLTAKTILIATGGAPTFPLEPGWEHGISSNEAFHLKELPKRVVIAGGGFIAVEFAGIFNGLGSRVTQVYRGPQILRGFDDDVRNTLAGELVKKGIDLIVETTIDRIEKREGDLLLHLSDGSTLETDVVMAATGRKPNVENLGLEAVGVALDRNGAVKVDEYSRSSVENIYAVGDVTDRINLTPVAIQEAMAFVDTVFRGRPRAMDHADVPSAVFSHPPVSTVGLTELQARERHGALDIYRSTFRPLKHTLSGRDEKTMMKLIVAQDSQRVVGVHMVGLDAPEIVQGMAVAIKAGATKQCFDATVGIHPTAAEEFVTMREPLPGDQAKAAE
ncbi:MAG: glutathione-disulfide reductase [Kiloniellaceae bacterium]|nr:glutathione-disulfide reductase [Kiloniellaceae bacterium]